MTCGSGLVSLSPDTFATYSLLITVEERLPASSISAGAYCPEDREPSLEENVVTLVCFPRERGSDESL